MYLIESLTAIAAMVPAIDNPIDGVVPDFTIFGAEFNSLWKKLFAALWALALIYTIARLAVAIAAMSNSKGGHPQQLAEHRAEAAWAGGALAGVAALGVIVTAILTLVS